MCMRSTVIKGIDDNLRAEIPGMMLICAIMKIGEAKNPLTFEACLTGAELLTILNEAQVWNAEGYGIKEENRYNVVAFDL